MSYMKCGNCESWERCVECGWCVFCAESEKAKLLSEIERLRRVERAAKNYIDYTMSPNNLDPLELATLHYLLKAALEEK